MVYRIAFAQVKDKTNADDVFQEVFLRLQKSAAKLTSDEHTKAWLIRTTINESRRFLTSFWQRKIVKLPEDLSYEQTARTDDIIQAIRTLPPKYAVVIHLFYYEDMSIKEIAAALKSKENTIKSQLSRAREMLRPLLKEEFSDV
jgi:RNA polymerase sigma-70 factor (ECF subfamily)